MSSRVPMRKVPGGTHSCVAPHESTRLSPRVPAPTGSTGHGDACAGVLVVEVVVDGALVVVESAVVDVTTGAVVAGVGVDDAVGSVVLQLARIRAKAPTRATTLFRWVTFTCARP